MEQGLAAYANLPRKRYTTMCTVCNAYTVLYVLYHLIWTNLMQYFKDFHLVDVSARDRGIIWTKELATVFNFDAG